MFDSIVARSGRVEYSSDFGAENWLELNYIICDLHRKFYEAVRALPLKKYVQASKNPALVGAFQQLVDAWSGDDGFLGKHRLKGYNFVELALKTGRASESPLTLSTLL